VSIFRAINHGKHSDRRWARVALAFMLLLGATILAAQESPSHGSPRPGQEIAGY
jgi:hypothetical protein